MRGRRYRTVYTQLPSGKVIERKIDLKTGEVVDETVIFEPENDEREEGTDGA